ncbi:MAG: hypothetical protein ACJAY8_000378 [Sphingobacteriales bacterium]|jgi:hypothetical protein
MNTEQFKYIIQNPWEISGKDLPDLERIISLFPYFEEARLLYLLALVRENDLRFPEELRTHIPFISNRKNLKKWVGEFKEERSKLVGPKGESELPITPEKQSEQSGTLTPTKLSESPESKAVNLEEVQSANPEKITDQETPTSPPIPGQSNTKEVDKTWVPGQINEPVNEPVIPIEKRVQRHPLEELTNNTPEDDFLEKLIISSAINSSIQSEVANPEEILKGPEEEEQTAPISGSSLGSWLRQTKHAQTKKPSMDLIDKFIETAPTKISMKRDFFSAEDFGKKSTVDAEELITETLLEIYLKQGDYEKVIRGYKKLALKFPEKKSYFAARIDGVKQIKNEKKK